MRTALLLAYAVLLLLVAPAVADDRADCTSSDPDSSIRGCSRIIKKPLVARANRAIAYYNRGVAYANKGDYERAIADFGQAIRLRPDYAEAHYNRGLAYIY